MSETKLKQEVDKLFSDANGPALPADNPRTRKISYPQAGTREITPEAKRLRRHSPPWQFLTLAVVLIPLAFVVKSCIAPTANTPAPKVASNPIPPVQAAVICGPANQSNPICQNNEFKAKDSVNNQKSKILSNTPPTVRPAVNLPKIRPQVVTRVVRIPQASSPQSYQSQPQQQVRQTPPMNERQLAAATSEQIWQNLSKDGVMTSGGGNNFTPPSEPDYVSESGSSVAMTSPVDLAPSFKGKPKAEAEGKLMEPIQLTSDVDAAQEEYEIKLVKAFGSYPEGTIFYAKIDGTPSQAGFINLKPVGSSQGDVSSQNIEIKKMDGGMLKASMKGTGRGIGNTIASILFGGVRIAMGGFFGGGGALNSIGQNASNEGINAAQNAFQNRRAAPYFELSKGTTVKLLMY